MAGLIKMHASVYPERDEKMDHLMQIGDREQNFFKDVCNNIFYD